MTPDALAIGAVGWTALLGLAPLIGGVASWTKIRLSGRTGPGPLQPYRLLAKLLRKEGIAPEAASSIYLLGPLVATAAVALMLVGIPVGLKYPALPWSDAVAITYLLMLATFLTVLAALDTGTTFGGLGASRETMLAALAEPTLMVVLLGVVATSGTVDLGTALLKIEAGGAAALSRWVIAASLLLIGLAENARLPFDNPTSHLELTMVHEAMVLEYSGPQLALIHYQSAAKLTLFWLLVLAMFFPPAPVGGLLLLGGLMSIGALALKLIAGGLLLGLVETILIKVRIFRAPDLLSMAFVLALFGLMLGLVGR
ncbi:MAG: NADH-quinone oxidoreductase subunit H [Chloroflexi bacterium]|nr:NADH-quinone oxidoreductase subunit H [Chloroflexota bacterium]